MASRAALALVVMLLVAACAQPGPSPSPSAEGPGPTASTDPDTAYAIAQRRAFGLQADLAWVEAVAADPRSRIFLLDIPMLPEEEVALRARQAALDEIAAAAEVYGLGNPDVFGGVYIDPAAGRVVALFTRDPELHRQRIFARLNRVGPLEVRQVRYTKQQLQALADRIGADWEWPRTVNAVMEGVGVHTSENLVLIWISSANPLAPGAIVAHFGVPPDMIRVESDGTGVALMPRVWIDGVVVDRAGRRVGGGSMSLAWKGAQPGTCGGGDIGFGVRDDGTFELPCTPGTWTITVEVPGKGDGQWVPIGHGLVVVPAAGRASMTITLD